MTKPYYQDEHVVLYHGDCREILPTIDGYSILITDPPFGIGFSEYASHADNEAGYRDFIWSVIGPIEARISNSWCVVFQGSSRAWRWSETFEREFRLIAYPKTFVQMLKTHGPVHGTDYALFWKVGEPKSPRGRNRDWCVSETSDMGRRIRGHPCPRPIQQMLHCVDTFTIDGDVIIDPFAGSGSTLVAAADLNRKAIGIEIEERYCEIAARRLSSRTGNLFA